MKLSEALKKDFIKNVVKTSKGKLNNTEDLERLAGLAFEFGNFTIFEDLAFHAKYLNGLVRIIRNKDNTLEDEYFVKIKKEYEEHIKKVKELFLIIIEPGSGFIKEIFMKKYFELNVESLERLNSFCEDLEKVKYYINELKEKEKGF